MVVPEAPRMHMCPMTDCLLVYVRLCVCVCVWFRSVSFRQLLSVADKDVVYPILKWVVPQPQLLEKRAFVGYYLSFPDVSVCQAQMHTHTGHNTALHATSTYT